MLRHKNPQTVSVPASTNSSLTRTEMLNEYRELALSHAAEQAALLATIREHKRLAKTLHKRLATLNTKLSAACEQLASADLEKNALMASIQEYRITLLELNEALRSKKQEVEALGRTIQERKFELANLTAQTRIAEARMNPPEPSEPPKVAEKKKVKSRFPFFSCCSAPQEDSDQVVPAKVKMTAV